MSQHLASLLAPYAEHVLARDDAGRAVTYAQGLAVGQSQVRPIGSEKALVFLLATNTVPSLTAYIGLLSAGHAVLLVHPTVAKPILEHLIETYRPDALMVPDAGDAELTLYRPVGLRPLYTELAILLSTSGSTGSPKLACFRLTNAIASARSIAEYLRINSDERPLLHLPMHYSFGLSIINSHLIRGAAIELTNYSVMQGEFWNRVKACAATSFSGVPFHFEMLRRLGPMRLKGSSLTTLTQAGGRLAPDLVSYFAAEAAASNTHFFVMYGQTEAGPRITYLPPHLAATCAGSIGVPIPGVRIELVDNEGRVCHGAEPSGELVCFSPAVMLGYAQSAADLGLGDRLGGRLATGDLARRSADGLYYLIGRKSRFVKLMGTRVSLDDIEDFVRRAGHTAACVAEDDWLCVVLERSSVEATSQVRSALIKTFKIGPRCVQVRSILELPRAESGKLRYGELLKAARA